MANKKEMKQEAISRMQQLKIDSDVIELFSENDKLMCSENGKFVEVPAEILIQLRAWEKEYYNLVYHVIHTDYTGFETYECLSVSFYKEDWDYENARLNEGWTMSHSINITIPDCTESGIVKIENYKGSLMRIG